MFQNNIQIFTIFKYPADLEFLTLALEFPSEPQVSRIFYSSSFELKLNLLFVHNGVIQAPKQ